MTLEEALSKIDSYTSRERATHEKVYSAYVRVREHFKGSVAQYDKYEMVRREYGGGSTGTVAKYLPPIETVERAKQKAESKGTNSAETTSAAKPVAEPVQKKLDAARAALEAICPAIIEANTSRDAELAASYQLLIDEQKAALVVELGDVQARNDELEKASIAAGQEAEDRQWQLDETRAAVETLTAERDSARADATRRKVENELNSTRLDAAEAQINTHQRAEEHYSAELGRLLREREPLARDAERGRDARAELDRLRRRLDDAEARKRELTEQLHAARTREDAARERHEGQIGALLQRIAALEAHLTRLLGVAVIPEGK